MTSQKEIVTSSVKCLVPDCKKKSKYGSLYCRDHLESKYATCILCDLHDHDQFSQDEYRIVETGSFIEIEQYVVEHFWENDGRDLFGIYMDHLINGKPENPVMFIWTPTEKEYKDGEVEHADKLCGKYVVFDIDIGGGGTYQYHELKDARVIFDNKLNEYKKGNKLTDHGYYPILALYQFNGNGEYEIIEDEEIFVSSDEIKDEEPKEEKKSVVKKKSSVKTPTPAITQIPIEDRFLKNPKGAAVEKLKEAQLRKKEYQDKLHSHSTHNHKIKDEKDYIYFLYETRKNPHGDECKFVADGSVNKIREFIDTTYGEKYIDFIEEITEDDIMCELLDDYSFELSDDLSIDIVVWSPGEYKDGKSKNILHGPNIIGEYQPDTGLTMYQYRDVKDAKTMYANIITEYKKGNNLMNADYTVTMLQITFDDNNDYKYSTEYIPVKHTDREYEDVEIIQGSRPHTTKKITSQDVYFYGIND